MTHRISHRFQEVAGSVVAWFVVLTFPCIFLNACKENPGEYSLRRQFVESQTSLNIVDTFSVKLSTVMLDSVQTSGTRTVLLGNYSDAVFGNIASSSYMQMAIPTSHDVQQSDRYNALYLVLKYNGYYFGDTTKPFSVSAHRLTEKIEYNYDNVINSTTSFRSQSDPLGSVVFTPRPNSGDTIAIKIHDDIGAEFFAKLRDGAGEMSTDDLFADYFPGIVLIADETNRGCITGFSGNPQDVRLVLLTTRSDPAPSDIKTEFTMYDSSRQFNHISYDRSATQLKALSQQRTKLPSGSSGGLSFLQGGVGLMIRVDFPSLREALLFNKSALVAAQLSIAPLTNSYNVIALPGSLILYTTDAINRSGEGVAASTLTVDELYHEETAYTFNITQYLKGEFSDSYVDPDKGLLITLPSSAVNTSFARFIADAGSRKMKLKLYYLSY